MDSYTPLTIAFSALVILALVGEVLMLRLYRSAPVGSVKRARHLSLANSFLGVLIAWSVIAAGMGFLAGSVGTISLGVLTLAGAASFVTFRVREHRAKAQS